MTTFASLRQTLLDDYLEPPTERTTRTPLTASLSAVSTDDTVAFNPNVLAPEELAMLGPGSEVEIGIESMFVTGIAGSTLTVVRGYRGTTIATHDIGDMVVVPTRWSAASQHQALVESFEALFPPLYVAAQTTTALEAVGYVELPASTVSLGEVRVGNGTHWTEVQAELINEDPFDSASAKVQMLDRPQGSAFAMIRYGYAPTMPDTETETIPNFKSTWERVLIIGALMRLIAGVDLDHITVERLTSRIETEAFPVRTGTSLTRSLIALYEYLLEKAVDQLTVIDPIRIEMLNVEYIE